MVERTLSPSSPPHLLNQLRNVAVAALIIVVFGIFSYWSGVPADKVSIFWLGVGIFIAALMVFGFAVWHLLLRPLPAGQSIPKVQPIASSIRRGLALVLAAGGISVIVGGFWDEVWHRQYGVPFGEDFFWRPHLMMYFGFLTAIVLAFVGLYLVVWQGKGTFQQRFRANPVVGLMILVGGYLMFVLPADPIWHTVYGTDLSAWGIPHLTIIVSFMFICLLAAATHLSTVPEREWRPLLRVQFNDLLPMLAFAACFLSGYQFFTTEWDNGGVSSIMQTRPEWLLPMLIGAVTLVFGTLANHALRLPSAATLSGLLALGIRAALIGLFDVPDMMFMNAWLLGILPLIALDLYVALATRAGLKPVWWLTGTAGALAMAAVLIVFYPRIYTDYPVTNLPITVFAIWVGAVTAGWFGAALGNYLATRNKQTDAIAATRTSSTPLISLAVLAACVAFIVFFVTTAAPPV